MYTLTSFEYIFFHFVNLWLVAFYSFNSSAHFQNTDIFFLKWRLLWQTLQRLPMLCSFFIRCTMLSIIFVCWFFYGLRSFVIMFASSFVFVKRFCNFLLAPIPHIFILVMKYGLVAFGQPHLMIFPSLNVWCRHEWMRRREKIGIIYLFLIRLKCKPCLGLYKPRFCFFDWRILINCDQTFFVVFIQRFPVSLFSVNG